MKAIFCGFSGLVVFSYIPSTLCFFSTIIFGVPSVDYWAIPLNTDQVYGFDFYMLRYHSPLIIQCFVPSSSLPINTRSAFGFAAAAFAESASVEAFMLVTILFMSFYVSVCVYFQPCVDDLASIIADASDDIRQRISMKDKLVQFIALHSHIYR